MWSVATFALDLVAAMLFAVFARKLSSPYLLIPAGLLALAGFCQLMVIITA